MTTTEQTTDTTYNGWTNYETWLVDIWLSNDEGTWDMLADLVSAIGPRVVSEGEPYEYALSRETRISDELSEFVSEYINEYMFSDTIEPSGLPADLINAALSRVNWYELAESYAMGFPYTPDDDDEEGDE